MVTELSFNLSVSDDFYSLYKFQKYQCEWTASICLYIFWFVYVIIIVEIQWVIQDYQPKFPVDTPTNNVVW